jgi:glyoxylase-like metal-dependent hydrolase (beta-lactamase superfamily II)
LSPLALPAGVRVFERGWLSSNNVLLQAADTGAPATLVDTGYATHAAQTVALLQHALGAQALAEVLNTHLHSDHCGGNAALQAAYGCPVAVPASEVQAVRDWDLSRLTYAVTGQTCPRFTCQGGLAPGSQRQAGGRTWEVLAAPGHDPHSVVLFDAQDGLLISADALWHNGFGVVFPEIEGEPGYPQVRATLELIARLDARLVIPGHGSPFTDVRDALARAFSRLDSFERDPQRHGRYAGKALLVFHLLETRSEPLAQVLGWLADTPYFGLIHRRYFADQPFAAWCLALIDELVAGGSVRREGERVVASA